MRVAIVSNWNERCGNAEYAANLVKHLPIDVDVKKVGRPLNFEHVYAETRDVDLIHFNCVTPEFRSLTTELWPWPRFKEGGKKLTMTLQDSTPGKTAKTASMIFKNAEERWSRVFDYVAVHDNYEEDSPYPNVTVIPHGLLLQDVSDVPAQPKIGSAGFPMPWKGFVETAATASRLGLGYLAIMPASHHIDVEQTKNEVLRVHPKAEVVTDWLTHEQIILRLAECFATVFAYDVQYLGIAEHEFAGISGGVRFGLSACRPIVISRNPLFRDLFKYRGEVYFMDDGLDYAIMKVANDWNMGMLKRPKQILIDMNWYRCAEMYQEMWRTAETQWVLE